MIGDRYKVPRLVAQQISSSARFRAGAGRPRGVARPPLSPRSSRRPRTSLSTFVATQSRLMADLFASMLSLMHERT